MAQRFVLNETSFFGRGCRTELPKEIQSRGFHKVLLVTDQGIIDCKLIDKITCLLDEAKIDYTIYSKIKPNPNTKNVMDGLKECKKMKADVIVVVGGGSAIDTAKCIAVMAENPKIKNLRTIQGLSDGSQKCLPIIALPTTHGTGSEVSIYSVIIDEEKQFKMVFGNPHMMPILAIVDSELMESLPKMSAAATGLDALTHAIEGYITKAQNTMSDMFNMRAIELIFENLAKAVNDKDPIAIENMALAQYIAGMGFSSVGLGLVHSMAHQLGAAYDTPHGIANALLLPTVMRFNGEVCADRFREILCHIGRPDARNLNNQDVINTLVWMLQEKAKECGVTMTVKDTGCKEEDIEMLAEKAMKDFCIPGNPREVTQEDVMRLYREAM